MVHAALQLAIRSTAFDSNMKRPWLGGLALHPTLMHLLDHLTGAHGLATHPPLVKLIVCLLTHKLSLYQARRKRATNVSIRYPLA
jgi:hypothetical protein